MQDNMKCNNIRIIGIPEGEEEKQEIENLFEKIMIENIRNFMTEKVTQVQEAQRIPIKRNPKRPNARQDPNYNGKIPRQRKNLKGSKGKKGSNIQGSPDKVSS